MKKPYEVSYKLYNGKILSRNFETLERAMEDYKKLVTIKMINEVIVTYLPEWKIKVMYNKHNQRRYKNG